MAVVDLGVELVQCLLREQFPEWADEPVRAVEEQGWDNRTFRVGADLSARLPSAAPYVAAVAKEQQWLPVLAEQLPVAIPSPVAKGLPGCAYPWPWSVCRWLPGDSACADRIDDITAFAIEVAQFLRALRAIDASKGPSAGVHSFGRGGPLEQYDEQTRAVADSLAGLIDVGAVFRVWDAALESTYRGVPVWVHGDMAASNLLVADGRLSAVIDFGTCAVGDPACDLALGWTFFDGASRETFLEAAAGDAGERSRGRGWVLWKALLTVAEGRDIGIAERRYGWRFPATDLISQLTNEVG